MSAKTIVVAIVLGTCGLLFGCGGDDTVAPTTNEAPILPPQNIRVTRNVAGEVIVAWDANTQSILRGYNVYRLIEDSSIQKLTVNPMASTYYRDSDVELNTRYDYRVTSVSTKGDESAYAEASILYHPLPADPRNPRDKIE